MVLDLLGRWVFFFGRFFFFFTCKFGFFFFLENPAKEKGLEF